IQEGGRTLQMFNFIGFQANKSSDDSPVLIVMDSAASLGIAPRVVPSLPVGPGPGVPMPQLDFKLDPARLPSNWLGFTSLRAVVIGPKEWEQLAEAQKDALLTWTASGGDLIFVD